MIDKEINKVKQQHFYNIKLWNKRGTFEIFNHNSKNDILCQLMDTVGMFNHAVSISGCYIYYSYYKKRLLWWNNHSILSIILMVSITCMLSLKWYIMQSDMWTQKQSSSVKNVLRIIVVYRYITSSIFWVPICIDVGMIENTF